MSAGLTPTAIWTANLATSPTPADRHAAAVYLAR